MLNKSLPDLRDPQRGALGFHSFATAHFVDIAAESKCANAERLRKPDAPHRGTTLSTIIN